jgi:hypothetical protein
MLGHSRALGLVVALAVLGLPSVAAAQSFDGTYRGTLTCDARGGLRPLKTELRVTVTGSTASYEREIMTPGRGCPPGGCPSGVYERGTGAVTPGGELALTGKAADTGNRYRFEAEYRGQLGTDPARLTGVQHWTVNGRPEPERGCQIELSPPAR